MRRVLLAVAFLVFACPAFAGGAPCGNDGRYCASASATTHIRASVEGAGRPAGCPRLWCGCWARLQAGISDPAFNLAKRWLTLRHVGSGRGAPVVGAWAVMSRRGGGHVGKVIGVDPNGNPIVKSGNHGSRVGVGVYPRSRVIAYVQP